MIRGSLAPLVAFLALVGSLSGASCAEKAPAATAAAAPAGPPPDSFRATFETSRGRFVVEVHKADAPYGADRFYTLARSGFFDDGRFFRVVPRFVAQFGLNDKAKINDEWDTKRLPDDSVRLSNVRGTLTYAMEGPRSRSHQLFVNLKDNSRLDKLGFAPIGKVVEGMAVVDSLYSGYGDHPDQHFIQTMGNSYLTRMFPKLDFIKTVAVSP